MPLVRCSRCSQFTCDCARKIKARRNADASIARLVVARSSVCAICGEPPTEDNPLTLDHRVPISRGGSSDPSNLQAACRSCNSRKRNGPAS